MIKKKHIVTLLKIGIAIFAIWYLFKIGRLTKESFVNLFKTHNLQFIILSAFAFMSAQILMAGRLVFLLKAINYPLQFPQGFKLTMIGNFFNMVIPGLVGGDLVKGYYLFKNEEKGKGRSSGIIIMDRFLGLLATVVIGGVSLIYLLSLNSASLNSYHNELYVVFVIIGLLFCLLIGFLIFGRNQRILSKLKHKFTSRFRKSIFYHVIESFGILANKRRVLIYTFLLSLIIQFISLSGLLILSNILTENLPGIIALTAVSSIVILFGVIPVTPGNLGWTELIAAFGWSIIGSNSGAEIFLYWRIITSFCSLPGGALYIIMSPYQK